MTETSLFLRLGLGGAAGIACLVDSFYDHMQSDPSLQALRRLHPADLSETRLVLKLYLGEWTGGPPDYSARFGHPRLRSRHLHIAIGETERDDWLRCMAHAIAETAADTATAKLLGENFARLADWMRNQPGNPHDLQRVAKPTVANATLHQMTDLTREHS